MSMASLVRPLWVRLIFERLHDMKLCSQVLLSVSVAMTLALFADSSANADEKANAAEPKFSAAPAQIDFGKELGLPLQVLLDLDKRIQTARRKSDPVALANAAQLLAAAEKVSENKASLTADAVGAEAAELAKLRGNSTELQTVALLTGKPELSALAKQAAKREADKRAAEASGERTRGVHGSVKVQSEVNLWINIYINGTFVGPLPPNGSFSYFVGDGFFASTHVKALVAPGQKFAGARWQQYYPGKAEDVVFQVRPFANN